MMCKLKYVFSAVLFCITVASAFGQSDKKLKIIFAGDIMMHQGQLESAVVEGKEMYDFSGCFKYIRPVLQQADLAIGNLELTLPGNPPYLGYPLFRSPDVLAGALRNAGFDIMLTANNHSNDALLEGLLHTIEALDGAGFYQTGTFESEEERAAYYPLVVYKKGFKLVFLNYTYGTNNPRDFPPAIVNKTDEIQIEKDMKEARALSPDVIIVCMHWGKEYMEEPLEAEEILAGKLFEWGATMVIGAHPHVVQPVQQLKTGERQSDTRLVAYSLGNFISGQVKPHTDGGILLEVELTKNDNQPKAYISDYNFIPIWRYVHQGDKKVFRTLPVSMFEKENNVLDMSKTDRARMMAYAKYIRDKMNAFNCRERKISLQEIE